MSLTVMTLRQARTKYADAPDHSPYGTFPPHGNCVCTAIDRSWCYGAQGVFEALSAAAGVDPGADLRAALIRWNADATTEEVLAAFDRAITAEESA